MRSYFGSDEDEDESPRRRNRIAAPPHELSLTADWSSYVWLISGTERRGYWLWENEDDGVDLVFSYFDADGTRVVNAIRSYNNPAEAYRLLKASPPRELL